MKDRLLNLIEYFRASLWFVPVLMVLASIGLAFLSLVIDRRFFSEIPPEWWLFTGSPESARNILGTIAGSMITVAGLVFSLTMVTLTLAAQQFGPRILRSFISDRGNQLVLGTFVSTFTFSLVVLRSVRSVEQVTFIPHVSVMAAMVLAIVAMMVLIYFIHHISTSIQADYLVGHVSDELEEVIRRIYPAEDATKDSRENEQARTGKAFPGLDQDMAAIDSRANGYIQTVDYGWLKRLAIKHDVIIKVEKRAGHYLLQKNKVAYVFPASRWDEKLVEQVNRAFVLGYRRTPTQDVEFGIDILVEIALRALSPSMNDPFTALSCIDRLGVCMTLLANRGLPSPYVFDENGDLRVIKYPVAFPNICEAAFNQIRQSASHMPAVVMRLLEIISALADEVHRVEDAQALRRHADMIRRAALNCIHEELDRQAIEERYREAMSVLQQADQPYCVLPGRVDLATHSG